MIQSGLVLRLGGERDGIAAATYSTVIGQVSRALEEIGRVLDPGAKTSSRWNVVDVGWRARVGASVVLSPAARTVGDHMSLELLRPSRELWDGVMRLEHAPEIPPAFSSAIIERVASVRRQIKSTTGLTSVSIAPAGEPVEAEFTEAVEANAARAVAAASFAYGSIAGRLDLISARTKRRRIGLRADDGHSVICDVHGMDEGAYMAAFAKDVLVIGTIKRNISGQAVSVMVDELRVREALPPVSARALLGAQPDLGGDLSAVEYIRSVRRDG